MNEGQNNGERPPQIENLPQERKFNTLYRAVAEQVILAQQDVIDGARKPNELLFLARECLGYAGEAFKRYEKTGEDEDVSIALEVVAVALDKLGYSPADSSDLDADLLDNAIRMAREDVERLGTVPPEDDLPFQEEASDTNTPVKKTSEQDPLPSVQPNHPRRPVGDELLNEFADVLRKKYGADKVSRDRRR